MTTQAENRAAAPSAPHPAAQHRIQAEVITAPNNRRALVFSTVVVVLLDIAVTLFLAKQIITFRDYPFDTDEAVHANAGMMLALDLRAGDIKSFATNLYWQDIYPPGFSWITGLAFLFLGSSRLVARLCSLACFFVSILVLYAVGLELDKRLGWLIGLVAAVFTLSAQTVLTYSTLVMSELPGLLASFLTLWAYLRAVKQGTPGRLALVSVLLAGTVLVKYPYGLITGATIALMEILRLFSTARQPGSSGSRWIWLFGPFAAIMLVWFFRPEKVAGLVYYATLQPNRVAFLSLENFIYYPRSIALHYLPSPVFSVLAVAGVIWAIASWRNELMRVLLLYSAVGLLVMTVKLQKEPRFVLTVVPALYFLIGGMIAWFVSRLGAYKQQETLVAAGAVLCTMAIAMPGLVVRFAAFPLLLQVEYETAPGAVDLAAWIVAQIAPARQVYLLNPWDQFSSTALAWQLATQNPSDGLHWSDVAVPSGTVLEGTAERMASLRRTICKSGVDYLATLDGGPIGQPIPPEYTSPADGWIAPVAQRVFVLEHYTRTAPKWLNIHLLTRKGLINVMSASYKAMRVTATVYAVDRDAC